MHFVSELQCLWYMYGIARLTRLSMQHNIVHGELCVIADRLINLPPRGPIFDGAHKKHMCDAQIILSVCYICKEIGKVLQLKTGLVTSKEGTFLQLATTEAGNVRLVDKLLSPSIIAKHIRSEVQF